MQKVLNKIIWLMCIATGIVAIVQILMLSLRIDYFAPGYFIFGSGLFSAALFVYGILNIIVYEILSLIRKRRYAVSQYGYMCAGAVVIYLLWAIAIIMEECGW